MKNIENEIVTINDKEYKVKDLTLEAQKCVSQINDIQHRTARANMELELMQVAWNHFSNKLEEETQNKKDN